MHVGGGRRGRGSTGGGGVRQGESAAQGVKFTVITEWPEFTVRPEVRGQAECTGRVIFPIVAPTCSCCHDKV